MPSVRAVGFRIHGDGGDLVRDLLGEQHVLFQTLHFFLTELVFGFLQIAFTKGGGAATGLAAVGEVGFNFAVVAAGAAGRLTSKVRASRAFMMFSLCGEAGLPAE